MDEEPRREQPQRRQRYDNGNTGEQNRRKDTVDWDQMLLETDLDQWDVTLRRGMKDNLIWITAYRVTLGGRRKLVGTAIAFGVTLLAAFGSWIGTTVSNGTKAASNPCPSGYICIVETPAPQVSP